MNNPLNELSAVYNQNIAEGCECDEKKKVKAEMLPQGDSVDGGDAAKPGKNKNYVKPMATEGHRVKEYVSWRDEIREVTYGMNVANRENATTTKPQNSDDSRKEIKEKKIKNKIKINPPQSVTEGFEELGAVVVEMYELTELSDRKVNGMLKKRDRQVNKALDNTQNMDQSKKQYLSVVSDKMSKSDRAEKSALRRKHRLAAKEGYDMSKAPSIKDAKPAKKTNVKHYKGLGYAPTIKSEKFVPPYEPLKTVTDDQRKKREMAQKTKDHDDKMSGKLAEQSGGGMAKLGPRESGKRKDKGKKKPQAIRQSKARLAALKRRLNSEELSIKDQMRISREAAKNRNPNPDHRKLNAMRASNQKKDNRTDAQKMADATGPRPGSNYRGD